MVLGVFRPLLSGSRTSGAGINHPSYPGKGQRQKRRQCKDVLVGYSSPTLKRAKVCTGLARISKSLFAPTFAKGNQKSVQSGGVQELGADAQKRRTRKKTD